MPIKLLVVLMTFFLSLVGRSDVSQKPSDGSELVEPKVKQMVENLWSADDQVRWAAKLDILKAGRRAAPYLVSLLSDLAYHTDQPHFAAIKDEEGQGRTQGPFRQGSVERLDITWRLIWDCCELLGDMKSPEAVPLLIRVMEVRMPFNLFEKMSLEMSGLVKIGKPSIPALLETLETAPSIAASITSASSGADVAAPNTATKYLSDLIRQRVAIVLGEIGNVRALPSLKNLLKSGGPFEHGNVYVESAIGQIEFRR